MSNVAYSTTSRNKIEDVAGRAASDTTQQMEDTAQRAGEGIERARASAEHMARSVADQGREAGERVQQVAENMKVAIDKSVRDQPMATLVVAAAIGFVLGALWKS